MTLDEQIGDAIDRGDIEAACLIAAKLEKPQAYLDAMQKVHAIVANGMKGERMSEQSTGTQTDAFDADMEAAPGQIPERVIEELREACHQAADYSGAFADACKAQAEKYKIKPGALKRYIKALEGDKLEDVEAETDDLAALIARRT